jgi:hypothetical protein
MNEWMNESRPCRGSICSLIQWVPGPLLPIFKVPGAETCQLPPSSAKVNNKWMEFYFHSPTFSVMVLIKHSDNFTFTHSYLGD